MMDTVGNKQAKTKSPTIKVAGPNIALKVIDDAIQAHGGGGVTRFSSQMPMLVSALCV